MKEHRVVRITAILEMLIKVPRRSISVHLNNFVAELFNLSDRAKSTSAPAGDAAKPLIRSLSGMASTLRLVAGDYARAGCAHMGWRPARQPIKVRGFAVVTLAWFALTWAAGCSRQLAAPVSPGTGSNSQLPFDRVSDAAGISPTAGFNPDGIPAGTKLAIRLQTELSSAHARAGESFDAVVDEPVIVGGKTLVPQGANVIGSVLTAKASRSLRQPGYLRLTLSSIAMNGKAVPLRTSSIFAKGESFGKRGAPTLTDSKGPAAEPYSNSSNGAEPPSRRQPDVKFSTGRRLTFRLTQSLHLQG